MKKIFLSLLAILLTIPAMAQFDPLPIDPTIRKGVLPNGLTYYIRQNAEPQGQAEFFIAQRVGSVQEEENQRGLAHFLEHMAFNGTRHFPDKTLFTFLEGVGVKFGQNLNAYTSFDETVYNISAVPVSRKGIIDSCLLILWDWADGLLLTDKDIEEERGVIREEMRTREVAAMRIFNQKLPEVFANSLYGVRLPIGTEEVVMGFTPQELRDYYEKWYRPDHQAIIVIGDIDPDYVEAKIKEYFGQIETPTTPSELVPIPIHLNEEPIVVMGTDPEMTATQIMLNFKFEPFPAAVKLSAQGPLINYMTSLATSMLNTRFSEISQKANAPFLYAVSDVGPLLGAAKTMNAFLAMAMSREGGAAEAFNAIAVEVARVKQHGFTASEFERAKETYLSNLERAYNERDKRKSYDFARECVRNFTDNEPMPGIEHMFAFINQVAPMIPVEQINMLVQQLLQSPNIVIFGMGPEKDGLVYPTREEFLTMLGTAMSTPQEAYVDDVLDEPLMTTMPTPGRVTKTATVDLFGAKEFTLSNGVRVIIKPTDFKDDEVRFTATSFGGNSLMDDRDVATFRVLDEVATVGGVGNFSRVNLNKALAGKQARVGSSVSTTTEGINGNGSPRDLETIMQLIYLYATAPRYDQEAFDSWRERQRAQLENMAVNPMKAFTDSLNIKLYGIQPRVNPMTIEDLSKIDYQKAIDLYKERFKDMSDFTFTFVGNIDEATFIPLMEQYLGALPSINRTEMYKDVNVRPLTGTRQSHFNREMQTVKASVVTVLTGKADYTPENRLKFTIFGQILDMVYIDEIREKEGGTYGVAVQPSFERYPEGNFSVLIYFDTEVEQADHLLSIVYRELERLVQEGPNQEHFDKVIAFLLKDTEEKRRDNATWLNAINEYAMYQMDVFTQREQMINRITPADIRAIARMVVEQGNVTEVVMKGVEAR